MDVFEEGLYPRQDRFKYPKAGERNASVKINIFHFNDSENIAAEVKTRDDFYIPRIKWSNQSNQLFVQRLNRHQNHLELLSIKPSDGKSNLVLEEKSETYIYIHDNLIFMMMITFFGQVKKNGYNHIYIYTIDGKEIRQITKGDWEITEFYGYNQKNKTLYYQSTEQSPETKRCLFYKCIW